MRRHLASAIAFLFVFGACAGDNDDKDDAASSRTEAPLLFGAFDTGESNLLAQIYGGALRAEGVKVVLPGGGSSDRRSGEVGRAGLQPALLNGTVDAYITYAGSEYRFAAGKPDAPASKLAAVMESLRKLYTAKGVTVLDASGAVDTNAFAVTSDTAKQHGLKALSDLDKLPAPIKVGARPDCPERADCGRELERVYGVTPSFESLPDGAAIRAAVKNGAVALGVLDSTDGGAVADGLVFLTDDKGLQHRDNIVPVIRTKALTDTIRRVCNAVSDKLTTKALAALNRKVEVDRVPPSVVAEEWLAANDFIER